MLHDKLSYWTHLTVKLPKLVDYPYKTTIWSTALELVIKPPKSQEQSVFAHNMTF